MNGLQLHDLHARHGASFVAVNGMEAVAHYGNASAEHQALRRSAAVLDLGFRSRLCVTGADRQRFLNSQVTNNLKDLQPGQGCYAAICNAKGRMQSDANIYCLAGELLLDLEPGLAAVVSPRLDQFIISDEVQITDVAPLYGLWSAQGPRAAEVVQRLGLGLHLPSAPLSSSSVNDPALGEIYCMNHPRVGSTGFDLFVPGSALDVVAERLVEAVRHCGGVLAGWDALETARIEAGIPRFGQDMDDSNLPPECGIEDRAISYTKGCYIGQEVIARLRSIGQVTRTLCGLRLEKDLKFIPQKADKLLKGDREIGHVTSYVFSPALRANIALGYVRREHNQPGTPLVLRAADGACTARVADLPFQPEAAHS